MLLTAVAFAGKLDLHDDADVLDVADEENLVTQVRLLPFDAWVLTTNDEPDVASLEARAKAARTKTKQLAIAVSPKLRRTQVEVGSGLGLSSAEIAALANSGDSSFKSGHWFGGLTTIVDQASRPAPRPEQIAKARTEKPIDLTKDDPSIPILAVIGGVLAIGTAIALAVLRRTSGRLKDAETKLPD